MNNRLIKVGIVTFIVCVTILCFVFSVFRFGPFFERQFFPVFTNIKGTFVSLNKSDRTMDFLVMGEKTRECLLTAVRTQIYSNGHWVAVKSQMIDENGDRLPIEKQRIAVNTPFVRRVRVNGMGEYLKIETESRCHPFWLSNTYLLELKIPIETMK